MGRAGAGGGGGHHSSGGGHHTSRSGSGHHMSSSSSSSSSHRPSSGSNFSSSRSSHIGPSVHVHREINLGRPAPPPPPPPRRNYGGYGGYMPPPPPPPRRSRHYRSSGSLSGLVVALVLIVVLIAVLDNIGGSSDIKNTRNREKLSTGNAFINDCIVDELGWFNNVTRTETKLKDFWKETGVQPFIYLKAYDPSLTTDAQKDAWALQYYDDNFDTENIFMYVYFADRDEDNVIGYMYCANGYQTSEIMDAEAVEIFWNYIDSKWIQYDENHTDEMFIDVFNSTAKTIMTASKTGADVAITVVIVLGVIVVLIIAFVWWTKKRQAEAQRAQETERILNTPMQDLVNENLNNR